MLPHGVKIWYWKIWKMCREAVVAWVEDRGPSRGAALAFYTLFSISPILIIVTSVAGFFLGYETVQSALVEQSRMWVGKEGAEIVTSILQSKPKPSSNFFAGVFGLLAMLMGSTTVFTELKDTLDQIWKAKANKPPRRILSFIWVRVLSLVITLAMTLVIMVSIVFSTMGKNIIKFSGGFFSEHVFLLETLNFLSLLVMSMVLFATIYKILPNARIEWEDVWVGAAITSVLFTLGKTLIGFYLVYSATTSIFGAAGSLILLLFWIYYSAQIFLLGAEFTKLYANHFGSRSGDDRIKTWVEG